MKINKFKVISIAICCFVAALWSEAQGMENRPDILESKTVKAATSMQLSNQHENDDFTTGPISSRVVNLEDSYTSWASYLVSPIKSVIQIANELTKLATNNPKLAVIVGMYNVLPAAEACACVCCSHYFAGSCASDGYRRIGEEPSVSQCITDCSKAGWGFIECY